MVSHQLENAEMNDTEKFYHYYCYDYFVCGNELYHLMLESFFLFGRIENETHTHTEYIYK